MTLDELLNALFPAGHETRVDAEGILYGNGASGDGQTVAVIGLVGQTPLGVEGALTLAGHVLTVVRQSPGRPIIVLLDAGSQRMRRRDELLGLNEYLAHATKCFTLAAMRGHRTVGVLFGTIAAGAFLATGLAQEWLVAVPGGNPMVMDLPSVARVTKLPLERLELLSKDTPVFAPGLAASVSMGAVAAVWEDGDLGSRLTAALHEPPGAPDRRDQTGLERKGRRKAAEIARRVQDEAAAYV
jgi:malonate decarboxylase gamma subunit